MLLFLHFSSSSQVLLTCRRVRTMTSLSLTSFATVEDNDRIEVICRTYWGRGGLKGLFSPPFLTLPLLSLLSPSPFPHSHSHFIPPSRPRTPSLVALKVYGGVQGAGGMERGERGGRRKKWRKWDGEKEKGEGFKRVKGEGEGGKTAPTMPPTPP